MSKHRTLRIVENREINFGSNINNTFNIGIKLHSKLVEQTTRFSRGNLICCLGYLILTPV